MLSESRNSAERSSEKYETNKYDKLKSMHWISVNKEMNNRDKAYTKQEKEQKKYVYWYL